MYGVFCDSQFVQGVTCLSPNACWDMLQPLPTLCRISMYTKRMDVCVWITAKTSSPFICQKKKPLDVQRQTPYKKSLHMRSLSSYPLVVLGHNGHRDEEEKTKTNQPISQSRNANIRLLSLKKVQVLD